MGTINMDINLPGTKIIKTEKDQFDDVLITIETTEDHVCC